MQIIEQSHFPWQDTTEKAAALQKQRNTDASLKFAPELCGPIPLSVNSHTFRCIPAQCMGVQTCTSVRGSLMQTFSVLICLLFVS